MKLWAAFRILVYIVGLVSILYFFHEVRWSDMWIVAKGARTALGLIILCSGIAFTFGTLAWRAFLVKANQDDVCQEVSFVSLFKIRLFGETIALVTPFNMIGGEIVKGSLLADRGFDSAEITSSLVLSRLTLILSFIVLAAIMLSTTLINNVGLDYFIVGMGLFIGIIILGAYLFQLIGSTAKKLFAASTVLSTISTHVKLVHEEVGNVFSSNPLALIKAFIYSILHWLIMALEVLIILLALGITINYSEAMKFEYGVMLFKTMGAAVPLQVGIEEYGNMVMLKQLSYFSPQLWVAVSMLRRARQLFFIILSGIIYLLHVNLKRFGFN